MEENKEFKEPLKNWMETPYERAPWVPIKHGEVVAEPNEQKSNNDLSDREVLQPRDEKINSHAFPLAGGKDPAPLETGSRKLQDS